MIAVLDYGVGNLASIINMLQRADIEAQLVTTPLELRMASKVLLPGVGSFDNGMRRLAAAGFVDALHDAVSRRGVPILGICLGMQMLGHGSEEGVEPGLGFIDSRCVRLRFPENPELKIPHMGWNVLVPRSQNGLFEGLGSEPRFYFVHSYHMVCENPDDVVAISEYGGDVTAVVHRGNVVGAQFHPEKSHRFGMAFLRNFARL